MALEKPKWILEKQNGIGKSPKEFEKSQNGNGKAKMTEKSQNVFGKIQNY